VANRRADQVKEFLEPGEAILALTDCQPPSRVERQMGGTARVVVTDRRVIALEMDRWSWSGRCKRVVFDCQLRDVISVETEKRHPIALFGVPLLAVSISLVDGRTFTLGASGGGITKLRTFAEVLRGHGESIDDGQPDSPFANGP
jgi:hypothetical protein